jgi:hypothetical protein
MRLRRVLQLAPAHPSRRSFSKVVREKCHVNRENNWTWPIALIPHRAARERASTRTSPGAINSLMANLIENRIRSHMPHRTKSARVVEDYIITVVRTYLK